QDWCLKPLGHLSSECCPGLAFQPEHRLVSTAYDVHLSGFQGRCVGRGDGRARRRPSTARGAAICVLAVSETAASTPALRHDDEGGKRGRVVAPVACSRGGWASGGPVWAPMIAG